MWKIHEDTLHLVYKASLQVLYVSKSVRYSGNVSVNACGFEQQLLEQHVL